jgi:steroid delta-isomerase-like uncharacterized protein
VTTTTTRAAPHEAPAAEAARVARAYMQEVAAGDTQAHIRWYTPEAEGRIHGMVGPARREEIRAFFAELFGAFDDFEMELLDIAAGAGKAAVRWRMTATFSGAAFQGIRANGAAIELEGIDMIWVAAGRITRVESYTDNSTFARQVGLMPPRGSRAERLMTRLFNAKTRFLEALRA